MNKNTSISLGPHFNEFVEAQLETGRYNSVSEVIRDALRLLEREEEKRNALRQALTEGEQSGPGEPFDINSFLKEMRSKYGSKE